jgi:predicted dehydrogenase
VKQVLQDRNGKTVVRDVPWPPCPPGFVLVQNAFSIISSGTERARLETSRRSLVGKAMSRPDLVREVIERARREGITATRRAVRSRLHEETAVGYSSSGRVLEVGETVSGFQSGDLVACAGGGYANHAEVVSVPANLCAKVPPGVPLEAAAATTIASIALHGIRLADVRVGERVAVIGCGLVGRVACRILRAAGAETFAIDVDPGRVKHVRADVDHAFALADSTASSILSASGGIGMDAVLVTAASRSNDPLLLAAKIARDRGAIVLVGDVAVEMPRSVLYDKELSFRVSRSYGPGRYDREYEERGLDYPISYVRWTEQRNMQAILDLQARGKLALADLIEVLRVEEAPEAYARLVAGSGQQPRGAIALAYGELAPRPKPHPIHVSASPSQTPKTAPRTPIRVGLIGPGNFARRVLLPAAISAGAVLEVVGGGSGPAAEALAREAGFRRTADGAQAVIEDPAVDAIIIATRHGSHARLTKDALNAGKHVFCEKPLALTQVELEDVLQALAAAPGILAVGFNRRFSPFLRRAAQLLEEESGPTTTLYRISAGTLPPGHWLHDLQEGGGRALGELCHFVDSALFLTGAPITRVFAVAHNTPGVPLQARDNLAVSLSFADGSVASIVYVADGSPKMTKERIEAFSGNCAVVVDDYRNMVLYRDVSSTRHASRVQDKGHAAEIEAFLNGVRAGRPPVSPAAIANVSVATLAVVESLRTASQVVLEPSGEEAISDPDSNQLTPDAFEESSW